MILALRILSFAVLLIASPAGDPGDLVGTWTVDLRPTPDSGPYYQPFSIQEADFQTLSGTFYGSPIQMAEINTAWDRVEFAFVTTDGSARYVTIGSLEDGTMRGTTYSSDRGLLQPWTAERD